LVRFFALHSQRDDKEQINRACVDGGSFMERTMTTIQLDDHTLVFGVLGIVLFVMGLFVVMAMVSSVETAGRSSIPPIAQMTASTLP
jgi:hypothetical protein